MTGVAAPVSGGWLWGPRSGLALFAALVVLGADQAHKWWMIEVYRIAEKGVVHVTPFLDLVFVKNTGVSYGFLNMATPEGQALLAGLAALASIVFWVWLARAGESRIMAVSLALIIGGAIGNAIDRLTLGGVADFFRFHAYGWSWYVFNIADVAIVAGVAGLLYDSFIASRNRAANA